jgi:transposase
LILRRKQLARQLEAERNRRRRAPQLVVEEPAVRASIDRHLAHLRAEIDQLEAIIEQRLAADPARQQRAALLASAPGVGKLTSASLIALVPELGRLDGKQAAALVGVAPFARDSGQLRGKRKIEGGRGQPRALLDVKRHPELTPHVASPSDVTDGLVSFRIVHGVHRGAPRIA